MFTCRSPRLAKATTENREPRETPHPTPPQPSMRASPPPPPAAGAAPAPITPTHPPTPPSPITPPHSARPPGNFTQACHRTNLPFARRGPDIPGNLFRRSRNGKKIGRPFVRWPELRPDKSGPAQTGPASPARPLPDVVVAGRAPKSSQAARQNRRRPRAKRDAARQVGAARGR
jgi:hypothetical protein